MRLSSLCSSVFICGGILLAGCGSPSAGQGSGITERQDKALKDPMHYSPEMDNTDISGGGIGNLDRDGMRRDVDHVLNP